jgi:hypothetical protein
MDGKKLNCSFFIHSFFRIFFKKSFHLVLSNAALRELENNVTAGESSVDLAVGIKAVVDTTTFLLVKDNLDGLAAILLGADTLANNLNGVDDVGQNGVVDGSQSAGTRTLLGEGVARAGRALGAGEDTARGDDDDMAVGEFLLELTGQSVVCQLMGLDSRYACVELSTYRCWILWKPWRRGTGTKMAIAFLPWPTSICRSIVLANQYLENLSIKSNFKYADILDLKCRAILLQAQSGLAKS